MTRLRNIVPLGYASFIYFVRMTSLI